MLRIPLITHPLSHVVPEKICQNKGQKNRFSVREAKKKNYFATQSIPGTILLPELKQKPNDKSIP